MWFAADLYTGYNKHVGLTHGQKETVYASQSQHPLLHLLRLPPQGRQSGEPTAGSVQEPPGAGSAGSVDGWGLWGHRERGHDLLQARDRPFPERVGHPRRRGQKAQV